MTIDDISRPDIHELRWANGSLGVQSLGGMLTDLTFVLSDGRTISPLYRAPWHGEAMPELAKNPLLRHLTGEWVCAPFGPATPPPLLPEGWVPRVESEDSADYGYDHGRAANQCWEVVERGTEYLVVAIDLPETHDLRRIEREIRVTSGGSGVAITTTLHSRRDTVMPLALHPTFALPDTGVQLFLGQIGKIHTNPIPPVTGVSQLLENTEAEFLNAVPTRDGHTLDLTHLPVPGVTEELVQLQSCASPLTLRWLPVREGQTAIDFVMDWDTDILPDLLLWISQSGRPHAPWNGRNRALGIEPCASCFDLTRVATPPAHHPLGERCGVALTAGVPLVVRWSLTMMSR